MALSKNIAEYEDCREHLDRALVASRGIRVTCHDAGAAIHLRQRLYRLRQLEKSRAMDIYEVGDPRRNHTAYENLKMVVNDNSVEIIQINPLIVEEL